MAIDISRLSLNKNIPVPLYYQLRQGLQAQIHMSRKGDVLPSEADIANALGISRPTVRQAFHELADEGYIQREVGRGTYVLNPQNDEIFFQRLDHFYGELEEGMRKSSTRLLYCRIAPGRSGVNERLRLACGEYLINLCRMRFADKEPIAYLETFLPQSRFTGLEKEDFNERSLYTVMEKRYSCKVARVTRKIEAAIATQTEADILLIKQSSPIIIVQYMMYDEDGESVEYTLAKYRGDRSSFTEELRR